MFDDEDVLFPSVGVSTRVTLFFLLPMLGFYFLCFFNKPQDQDVDYIDHWTPVPYREYVSGKIIRMV